MPDLKNHPPTPKWYGTPADAEEAFVEFARHHTDRRLAERRYDLQREIDIAEQNKRAAVQLSARLRQYIAQYRKRLDELNQSLVDTSDLSNFEDALLALMDHPSVIGLRPDSGGRLIVHVRLFKKEEDREEQQYVGDFELAFPTNELDSHSERMAIVQTDASSRENWSQGFVWGGTLEGVIFGHLRSYDPLFQPLFRRGDLVGLIEAACERIVRRSFTKQALGLSTEPLEPAWQGVAPNLEQVLLRSIEWSLNRTTLEEIRSTEEGLAYHKREAAQCTSDIRESNRRLDQARSELEEMNRIAENNKIDEVAIHEQLRYIKSLPGVMGLQFITKHDDKIPVIHVRTSIVYRGERYDMGDYEVILKPSCVTEGVIRVRQTREANRRRGLYYHPASAYGYDHSWFCFGNRAYDLRQLFMRGEYGEFMHMVVNSLNTFNLHDEFLVPEYGKEIDMDAVWTPPTEETVRLRRRRRFRI